MDLRIDLHYPAGPEEVLAMLSDEAFLGRVATATGSLSHEASARIDGDRVSTRLHRVLPPRVPDYVRRFVGDTLDVIETIEWAAALPDSSRTGRLEVVIAKAPVHMHGSTTLARNAAATRQVIEFEVRANLPFIGGKIERSAADAVRAAARKQEQVGAEWLAGR